MTIRSPIRWIGGKGKLVTKILPLFPPHLCYVESFGGGAALLLAKPPADLEVYNDLNPALTNLFRDLQTHGKEVFCTTALTPFSRREQKSARENMERSGADVIVAQRQSFGGKTSGYGISRMSINGMEATVNNYLRSLKRLPQVVQRLQKVVLRSQDALEVIKEFDKPETLHYLDPPYVPESWTDDSIYAGYEMDREFHEKLVDLILGVKGMVLLSGYANSVYEPLEEAGWSTHEFATTCGVAARRATHGLKGTGKVKEKQARIERLWMNLRAARRLKQR